MERAGVAGLAGELARMRGVVRGRSPAYERALELLPTALAGPAARRLEAAWQGRRFRAWYERPLLLLAALRSDALASGPGHPLFDGFAADAPEPAAVTEARLAAALDGARGEVLEALASRSAQTNETARAVAWLWPAALAGASRGGRALAVADVGAGAGLNLVADLLPPVWTTRDGAPLETARDVRAVARLGLDPAPLDALDPRDAHWLRACVWPGDRRGEERLAAAIEAFRAARPRPDAPVLVPIGASNVPARLDLLSAAETGTLVVAYRTAVRGPLEQGERAEYEQGMRDWVGSRPPGHAAWIELEPSAAAGEPVGALVAHARAPWGEVRSLELARCDLHALRLEVREAAAAELRALLAAEAHAGIGA